MSAYVYGSLDHKRLQIRVFILQPAKQHHDPVYGELKIVSLLESPKYDALSYAWGPRYQNKHRVWVNEHRFLDITSNLHRAFLDLRLRYQPRILWIDAICVNQGDANERQNQVALMREI
ncbi:heterokaryon incompatibility protein-domain-containing protein [Xylariaceae sp. FL0016]|nr:heterokaryon incompatibility protein-domain-containing protein [Xylariaceae sp. FL0016]